MYEKSLAILLPSAVYAVLKREAERVFEIPAVMNTIFVDDLPPRLGTKLVVNTNFEWCEDE